MLLMCRFEKLGALQWRKIVHGNQGWRLVTANWLHAGLIHLVANMLSLVLIGIRLEQQFGFCKFFFMAFCHVLVFKFLFMQLLLR